MKVKFYLITAVLIIFALSLYIYACTCDNFDSIEIKGRKFRAEIVDSAEERSKGLSGRNGICDGCAMLFIFESPGRHSFWMKDMRFDIDIIWILGNRIVWIARNVSHQEGTASRVPMVEADRVVEVKAGLADDMALEVGNEIEFKID